MTLPRLPGIIPIDGSAAISGVCIHKDTLVQTHTHKQKNMHVHTHKTPCTATNIHTEMMHTLA